MAYLGTPATFLGVQHDGEHCRWLSSNHAKGQIKVVKSRIHRNYFLLGPNYSDDYSDWCNQGYGPFSSVQDAEAFLTWALLREQG